MLPSVRSPSVSGHGASLLTSRPIWLVGRKKMSKCLSLPPNGFTSTNVKWHCSQILIITLYCFQGQGVMKHGARGKKQTLKSASTDLGTTDVGESGGVFARRPRGPRCRVTTNKYLQCFQMPVMNIQMHLKSTSAGHQGAIFSFLIVAWRHSRPAKDATWSGTLRNGATE